MQQNKKWGENMIRVSIRFWTNNVPEGSDDRTAWEHGMITLTKNAGRNIETAQMPFRDMEDLLPKMAKLLKENKIKLIKKPRKSDTVNLDRLSGTKIPK